MGEWDIAFESFRPLAGSYKVQTANYTAKDIVDKGFRPLAGSYKVQFFIPIIYSINKTSVSVPLRGLIRFNLAWLKYTTLWLPFPSPCGVL